MMSRMEEFCSKYSINEEGKSEMLKILNESMVLISGEILKSVKVGGEKATSSKVNSSKSLEGVKRYKSKKAEEYAMESITPCPCT